MNKQEYRNITSKFLVSEKRIIFFAAITVLFLGMGTSALLTTFDSVESTVTVENPAISITPDSFSITSVDAPPERMVRTFSGVNNNPDREINYKISLTQKASDGGNTSFLSSRIYEAKDEEIKELRYYFDEDNDSESSDPSSNWTNKDYGEVIQDFNESTGKVTIEVAPKKTNGDSFSLGDESIVFIVDKDGDGTPDYKLVSLESSNGSFEYSTYGEQGYGPGQKLPNSMDVVSTSKGYELQVNAENLSDEIRWGVAIGPFNNNDSFTAYATGDEQEYSNKSDFNEWKVGSTNTSDYANVTLADQVGKVKASENTTVSSNRKIDGGQSQEFVIVNNLRKGSGSGQYTISASFRP